MKRNLNLFAISFCLSLIFSGCKKETTTVSPGQTTGFSQTVLNVAPQATINLFKANGMTINEGTVPPKIEGIYLASPFKLLSPYDATDPYKAGETIDDYKFKFYNQSSDNSTANSDFAGVTNGDKNLGIKGVVTGNGSKFTFFYKETDVIDKVSYTQINAISGEITSAGIKNFQFGYILTNKGSDPNNVFGPIGKGELWFDSDFLASTTSTFVN